MSIWRPRLEGRAVLDLFAGSGAVGLEALSLGAGRVVLVEQEPGVLAILRRNVARLTEVAASEVEIRRRRLPGRLPSMPGGFDLAFADPPYSFTDHGGLIRCTAAVLRDAGELVIEHSVRVELPAEESGWHLADRRRYGETGLGIYRQKGNS